ncbi:hypothetical protein KC19_8G095800 [Ceratodon purpureus]|uniref:AP2/ERF domain-containing protein n=1 Tax=Ceratodon purpureus TaxID=3225 RepID=A0A8T0H1I7_CERPU|nr:hypothetical protein KC19_8G095800 [Ceratodon purpureus]
MAEQAAMEDDDGDFMELDDAFYLNTCSFPGRQEPRYSPSALLTTSAHFSRMTASSGGAAERMEGEPVESDTAFLEPQRMSLAEDLFSEDAQVYSVNDIFESLQSTLPSAPLPVQNTTPDLEGRIVAGDDFNVVHPRPSIMQQPSAFGLVKKRKAIEAGDVMDGRVFRRKYLVTERSEGADPRVSPISAVPNSNNGEIDAISTPRGNGFDENEINPEGLMGLKTKISLKNAVEFESHLFCSSVAHAPPCSSSEVEHEQQTNSKDVGDPYAFGENYEYLYKPGDEVLLKTMGWFPVEEHPNGDTDPSLSVRWIIDEPPSASDLPHLESLLEISPSKFWSPASESRRRPAVRLGYLCCPESSESSHSIRYFLNTSPASSPEVTATMLHHAPGDRISSRKPSNQHSPAFPEVWGMAQNILTPARMGSEPMEASPRLPSLGSDRKLAVHVQAGVLGSSCARSEDNLRRQTSGERSIATLVHQDFSHRQETGYLTASEDAVRRLQRHGKNLVTDFLRVGSAQEEIEVRPKKNNIQHTDASLALRDQSENTTPSSARMRRNRSTGLSASEAENSVLSSKLQNLHGADGVCLVKRESSSLRPLSQPRNLAKGTRDNALHERVASQLLCTEPVSENLRNEHVVNTPCPEVVPYSIAWSGTDGLRVSRKRSSRMRKPKFMGVEVLGNGEVKQAMRTSPSKEFTCSRRKSLTPKRSTFEEPPTFPSNVNLRHLESAPTSDCGTNLRGIPMQDGTSPGKTPTLTRIIKPLRLYKTSTSRGVAYVRIKPILRSTVGRGQPMKLREVKPLQVVKNSAVKDHDDTCEAVLTRAKDPGVLSGEATQIHEAKDEIIPELSGGCEVSKTPARSSKYRGVTRHRHTGRYEAHLWDNTRLKLGIAKRGTQGAYPDEDQAAKAHDLAALKYWGPGTCTNFPPSVYEEELRAMKNLTKEEYVVILRRRSPGFTRGVSKYRGVTRHHQEGRWEARIGRHSGAKYHYLGTYDTQEEAAAAYDRAAVRNRGMKAITNFDISNYIKKDPQGAQAVTLSHIKYSKYSTRANRC